ncbi:MAG: efflux transporter outer membrane subunit [Burkholderiales bacterium]
MKQINNCTQIFLLLGLPCILANCALLGPKYVKPKVEAPKTWSSAPAGELVHESGTNLSEISWWTRFNDPSLNNLIEEGLANNNNIQIAIGNITAAQGILQRVKMSWLPTISLGGSAGIGQIFNFDPGINNSAISSSIPPGSMANTSGYNFYAGGLVPSYSLNVFQQLKQGEVAKANLASANYTKDATRLAVISQIAGSYFTLLALEEQLAEQKQVIADLTELVKLTKILYQDGFASLTDIQQYQQHLEQANMQLPGIENNIVQTQNALQVLLNRNPGKIIHQSNFAQLKTSNIIPVSLPSSVLRNRPDIMQAEEQLKIANANIGVATANFFPNISLTTPIGGFSNQVQNLFSPSGNFWTAQIMATMPILNLGLHGLIKEKKGHYYVAYYDYIQTVKTAFAQVDDNLSQYTQIQHSYAAAQKFYAITKSNVELTNKNYTLGYISYPESLSSKVTLDQAAITLTQIKLQQLQAIVNLYQSMAGGYNYNNTAKAKKFGDSHDA